MAADSAQQHTLTKSDVRPQDLSIGYFAVPFSLNVPRDLVSAISVITARAMTTEAARAVLEANFGVHRNQCPGGYQLVTSGGSGSSTARKQLHLDEMAGIFIVQVGFSLSTINHFLLRPRCFPPPGLHMRALR